MYQYRLDIPAEDETVEQYSAPVPGPLLTHAQSQGFQFVTSDRLTQSMLLVEPVTGDIAFIYCPDMTDQVVAGWVSALEGASDE